MFSNGFASSISRAIDDDVASARTQGDAHRARQLVGAAPQGFARRGVELDALAQRGLLVVPRCARRPGASRRASPS